MKAKDGLIGGLVTGIGAGIVATVLISAAWGLNLAIAERSIEAELVLAVTGTLLGTQIGAGVGGCCGAILGLLLSIFNRTHQARGITTILMVVVSSAFVIGGISEIVKDYNMTFMLASLLVVAVAAGLGWVAGHMFEQAMAKS